MTVDRYFGIVSGTKYYHIQNYPSDIIRIIIYDNSVPEITYSTASLSEATYTIPTNENLLGFSYDGSNLIYFVIQKDADSKYYLVTYSISGDSFTILGERNVCLMLDRNTVSGVMEKAFHLTEDKIYQLHPYASHQLYFIAKLNTNKTIRGITDNFVITDP